MAHPSTTVPVYDGQAITVQLIENVANSLLEPTTLPQTAGKTLAAPRIRPIPVLIPFPSALVSVDSDLREAGVKASSDADVSESALAFRAQDSQHVLQHLTPSSIVRVNATIEGSVDS